MDMNKEVSKSIRVVIDAWKTDEKKYTFESCGFAGFMKSPIVEGEVLIRFHIVVDGFFEDEKYSKPINLNSASIPFQTMNLSVDDPDNPKTDGIRLKAFLDKFTQEAYQDIEGKLAEYELVFTSDPLAM